MKSLLLRTGLLLVLVFLLATAFLRWTVSAPGLRAEIGDELRRVTGLETPAIASMQVAILPRPAILLEDVQIRGSNGAIDATITRVTGSLRLLPLLGGRLELVSARLVEPRITIDLDRAERSATAARGLGALQIENGSLMLLRPSRGSEQTITGIEGSIVWPSASSPASARMNLRWRDRDFALDAWASRPDAALSGQASGLTLQMRGPGLSLLFDGALTAGAARKLDGRLTLSGDSLRDVAGLLEVQLPAALRGFSAEGRLSFDGAAALLTGARLLLGRGEFEGSLGLAFQPDGRWLLGGTLATALLDVSGWAPLAATVQPAGLAQDVSRTDLDFRLSASRIVADKMEIEDAAAAVLLKSGRLEVNLVDARMMGGRFKGRATLLMPGARDESPGLSQDPMAADLRGTLAVSEIDLSKLKWPEGNRARLSGTAAAQVTFETSGRTLAEALANAEGRGQVSVLQGELSGLDLRNVVEQAGRRPLALAGELKGGKTAIERLTGQLRIAGGYAELADTSVKVPGLVTALTGRIALAGQQLQLALRAHRDAPGATADLPLEITGTVASPAIRIDRAALFARPPLETDPATAN